MMSVQISEAKALKLLKKGNVPKAASILKTLIATNTASSRAILTYSILLYEQKQYQESIKLLVELALKYPFLSRAHFYLGCCYESIGALSCARQSYWDAAITDINSWTPYYHLANIYVQDGNEEIAVRLYVLAICNQDCDSKVILHSVESISDYNALLKLRLYINIYLNSQKEDFNTLVAQGLLNEKLGNIRLSADFYVEASRLTLEPLLIVEICKSLIRINQIDDALACINSIPERIKISPEIIAYYSLVLYITEDINQLIEVLTEHINNRGLVVQCLRLITDHITTYQSFDSSIEFLSSLLFIDSLSATIKFLLAQASFDEGYYDLALTWINQIHISNVDISIMSLKGASLLNMGLLHESIDCHMQFIESKDLIHEPHPEYAFLNLAQSLRYLDDPASANKYYILALDIAPQCDELIESYFKFLIDTCRIHEAIEFGLRSLVRTDYINSLSIFSSSRLCLIVYIAQAISEINGYTSSVKFTQEFHTSVSALLGLFILSDVYSDEAEANDAYINFLNSVDYLVDCSSNTIYFDKLRRLFGTFDNFHLAYLMIDVIEAQRKVAACISKLFHDIENTLYDMQSPQQDVVNGRRLRIGFASANLCNHNGWTGCEGLVSYLHKLDKYDIFTFSLGIKYDTISDYWANKSIFYRYVTSSSCQSYLRAAQIISESKLDLLIYTDIGMGPVTRILSSLRLARFQGTQWGHPITTGSKNVDFYISSILMEDKDASSHYTEKLIQLDNNGLYYSAPIAPSPNLSREVLGLPCDSPIILSAQTVYKYHPKYDSLYPKLSLACPGSILTFIKTHPSSTRLRDRIFNEYQKFDLDPNQHVIFIEKLSMEAFKSLFKHALFSVDPPGWSGGNVSLQSLKFGCPVLTYPTEFMRGRHTHGFLTQLGLTELIAESPDDLIKKAGSLYADNVLLESIKEKLNVSCDALFYDEAAGESFANFIDDLFSNQENFNLNNLD